MTDSQQNEQNGQYKQNGQDSRDGQDRQNRQRTQSGIAEEAMRLFDSLQRRVGSEFGRGMGKGFVKGGVSGLGQAFGGGRPAGGDFRS